MERPRPTVETDHPPPRLDDPDVFDRLYQHALPRIYGYLYHRLSGRTAVAEEITQDVFLTAVGLIRRGTVIQAPVPWLFGIARHKLLEHYRRERSDAGPTRSWEDWRDGEAEDDPAWVAPWDDDGWQDRTLSALALLPAPQRQALILRHLDGHSVPEISGILDRSVHAVESLLARGRAGFKRHYLAHPGAEVDDAH